MFFATLKAKRSSPRILPDIEILSYRRTQVVAVAIFPSQARPHYVNRAGTPDGVYVRVGSTNRRADHALMSEMRRFAHGESFDERAMPDLDSEAIDFRAASESFAPHRRIARRDLATLKLTTLHQRRSVPTVGGILLFGRDRLEHFPDAWMQAGLFDGHDKTTILDHAKLKMPLLDAMKRSSMRLFTPTIRKLVPRFAFRSSTTVSRWRTRASCTLDSQ